MNIRTPILKKTQIEFLKAALSKDFTQVLYAGVTGTGKTYTVATFMVGLCLDFSNTRIGVFRKNLSRATQTVYHTYLKVLDDYSIPYKAIRGAQPQIRLSRNSTIEFFELDDSKDPDWKKVKGLELTCAHIDEVDEVAKGGKDILLTRIGRWNKENQPALIAMTCNPNTTWVKEEFYDPAMEGSLQPPKAFIQSIKSELDSAYLKILDSLPESERERYLENNWQYTDDPQQLIKYEWIRNALLSESVTIFDRLGVDVAREGDDRTVLAFIGQNNVGKLETYKQMDTTQTAQIVLDRIREYKIDSQYVYVDAIGLGAGVIDYLKTVNIHVKSYKSSNAATKTISVFPFKNLRAQSYWELREGIRTSERKILNDPNLIKELLAIRYVVDEKQIRIESKEQIKKRLGYSTDIVDAVVMAYSGNIENSLLDFYKESYETKSPHQSFLEFVTKNSGTPI